MKNSLLHRLIEAFTCLPGVGNKTAQRFVYWLLERDREGAIYLADLLKESLNRVVYCEYCRMFSEESVCWLCRDQSRDNSVLCVVENASGLMAIESSTGFRGTYFVLHGKLSPLDGIGPEEIGLPILEKKIANDQVKELILATSSTVEGDVTAHVISQIADTLGTKVTRLARGVPVGGDLEFIDATTLSQAFDTRRNF